MFGVTALVIAIDHKSNSRETEREREREKEREREGGRLITPRNINN